MIHDVVVSGFSIIFYLDFLEFIRPEVESLLVGRNEAIFRADEVKTVARLALRRMDVSLTELRKQVDK